MSLKVLCRIAAQSSPYLSIFAAGAPDSTHVVASATPVSANILSSSATDAKQLNALRSKLLAGAFIFQFDGVVEGSQTLAQPEIVEDLVTGRDAGVLVFGTSRSGKTDCHKELTLSLLTDLLRLLHSQRSPHSLGCRVISVGPQGVIDRKCYSEITSPNQVSALLQPPEDGRTAVIVRFQVLRGQAPLSVLDIVNLPNSDLARHKAVARTFNSLSAVLTHSETRPTALSELIYPALDIHHPLNPSQVLVVCCVHPDPEDFQHSLAGLKFTSRLRDCVKLRKMGKKEEEIGGNTPRLVNTEPRQTISRRELAIETEMEPFMKDGIPTTKASTTNQPVFAVNTGTKAPPQVKPLDLRYLTDQRSSGHGSQIWTGEQRISDLPSYNSSRDSEDLKDRTNRSMQTSGLFFPSSDREIIPHSQPDFPSKRPNLHLFPTEILSIAGNSPSVHTQEIQTNERDTVEAASQMVPVMSDTASQHVVVTVTQGANTPHMSLKSQGQQMSISLEQRNAKEMEEELRLYHKTAEELREELDRQREESEELIESLRIQLMTGQGGSGKVQMSSGVQTEAKGQLEKARRGLCDLMNVLSSLTSSGLLPEGSSRAPQVASKLSVALRSVDSWESLGEVLNLHLEALSAAWLDSLRGNKEEVVRGKGELEVMKKRMFDVSNLCATLEAEVKSLRDRLSASSEELVTLREDLHQANERARELQLTATQQSNRLNQQDSSEAKIHSLEAELTSLTQENRLLVKRIRSSIQEVDNLKEENTAINGKFKLLESIRAQEKDESAVQFSKLASEAQKSSELAQNLLISNKQKDENILNLKSQLQSFITSEDQLQAKEVENAQLRSSLNIALGEKEAAVTEIESLKKQLELAVIDSERCLNFKGHLENLQGDLEAERGKTREKNLEIDTLKTNLTLMEQEKIRLEERLMTTVKLKESQVMNLTAELTNIRGVLKEKTSNLQGMETREMNLQRELGRLRSDYDAQGKQLSEVMMRCQLVEAQRDQLQQDLIHTTAALEARQDQVDTLSLQASALTDALRETELDALRKDKSARSKGLSESDFAQSQRKITTDGKDMEIAALRKARDRLEVENKRLNEMMGKLNATLQEVQSSKKLTVESIFGQTLQQFKQKTESIIEVRDSLREIISRQSVSASGKSSGTSPKEPDVLQVTLDKLQAYLISEEQSQHHLTDRFQSLKSSTSPGFNSDFLQFLQQSLAPAPAFTELSGRSSLQIRSADHQLCELQIAELKATLAEIRNERDELHAQITVLRSNLSQKQSDLEKNVRLGAQKDLELQKLRQGLRAYEDIIAELRAGLQRSAAETQAALEEKLQALTEVKRLQQRLDAAEEGSKGRPGSLTDYLKHKDESEMSSRALDTDLHHFQRFKALWQASPFNTQSS